MKFAMAFSGSFPSSWDAKSEKEMMILNQKIKHSLPCPADFSMSRQEQYSSTALAWGTM